MKRRFLYVGFFQLPDKNAAAQRVVGIAKGLRELGYDIVFLNYSDCVSEGKQTEYFGFPTYELPKSGLLKQLTDIGDIVQIFSKAGITDIIAYNYPAIALHKLLHFCRRMGVRCYADVTEWYVAQGNFIYRMIKTIDTEWRMRFLHKKANGVIAISEYLYQYYKDKVHTVKIPPTVDLSDEKWNVLPQDRVDDRTVFVYAGSPTAQKERLDLILEAAQAINKQHRLVVRIIGITEEQYERMYRIKAPTGCAEFFGRISHDSVIQEIKSADWSIIIRDNNKVVKAGFPTKVVESISCGTPVIINSFSNVIDYLDATNHISCDIDSVATAVQHACNAWSSVNCEIFSYINYLDELGILLG